MWPVTTASTSTTDRVDTPLRLVIFDFDGTLVDSHPRFHDAICAACLSLGLPQPEAPITRATIGMPIQQAIRAVLPNMSHDEHVAFAGALHAAREFQRAGPDPLDTLFPHAQAVIETLYEMNVLLAIATNKSRHGLDHSLRSHGLERYFIATRTPDEGHSKPHPAMLHSLLRYTGVAPENAVFVGDTSVDMACAMNAGIAGIGAGWGYHDVAELRGAGARVVIPSFVDLGEALLRVWGRAS